jgi:hypothetical protein
MVFNRGSLGRTPPTLPNPGIKNKKEQPMAYDEKLAFRMRNLLLQTPGFVEKKMFGGVGFMIQGNMACGVHGDKVIVRLNPDGYEEALAKPFIAPFDLTGKPMRGWITVAPNGVEDDKDLGDWVQRGVSFAQSLPEK